MALPKRKRNVVITTALAGIFAVGAILTTFVLSASSDTYRPGEDVSGLTDELSRNLPDDHPRVTFTDVTALAGIHFEQFGGRRSSRLPEDMGSGAAWGDYNNDGFLDLYVAAIAGPMADGTAGDTRKREESAVHNRLYRNDGDGTFTDVSKEAGVDLRHVGMAPAWGDFDNDGWIDLLVTSYGSLSLLKNLGDGTFEDVSETAFAIGPEGFEGPEGFWAGAAWGDYDRDGHLDLYVTGYVKYDHDVRGQSVQYDVETPASINPSSFQPERNLLLRNRGNGTFEEVALRTGVQNATGRSLSAAWVDLDDDGWSDLYVANDVSDNALFRNRGDGTFDDISHPALVADYRGAMGIAAGDWDGDADVDLFITHWIAQENALYLNTRTERGLRAGRPGPLQFMDSADRYGVGQIALDYVGWGTSFIDYDNDGRLDLIVVNGSTFQQEEDPSVLVPMPDQLFWNRNAEEGFFDVSSVAGSYFDEVHVGRGAAFADYDNDGDVDAFVVNHGERAVLLRNDGGNRNAWIAISLEGTASNRSAIGASLRLVAGARTQVRQVGAQGSYLSQNSPIQHFGLREADVVDTLIVSWPSGTRDTLTQVAANRMVHLTEGRPIRSRREALP